MNKKNNLYKIINFITIIIFVVISYYSFRYTKLSGKYTINKIIISGNDFRKDEFITKIIKNNIDDKNIFNINVTSINKELTKDEFIESTKIFTIFPSTLSIIINEINPIALFENNNEYTLIDRNNNQISANLNSINYYSVPIISINEFNINDIYKAVNTLKYITRKNKNLYNSIDEIIIEKEFSYIIVNNTKIKLNKNNIKNDTFKFVQFINDTQDSNDINKYKYVNVTVPNQIIVKERKM